MKLSILVACFPSCLIVNVLAIFVSLLIISKLNQKVMILWLKNNFLPNYFCLIGRKLLSLLSENNNITFMKQAIVLAYTVMMGDDGFYYIHQWNKEKGCYDEKPINQYRFLDEESAKKQAILLNGEKQHHLESLNID